SKSPPGSSPPLELASCSPPETSGKWGGSLGGLPPKRGGGPQFPPPAAPNVIKPSLAREIAAGGAVIPWRLGRWHRRKRACAMVAEHRTDRIEKQRPADHSGGRRCSRPQKGATRRRRCRSKGTPAGAPPIA